ncbi:BREX-1 system adenine-specific DNA-methyltransferase PglX [Bacillus sp. TL12]|uniref:BREX-1 system adenine-specific DNA-methyltransferase PglX n=1 Tax=Bacillus sp. TL12 TaxID=2894756 RepID=UPI001F525B40|nr:BREX-1 system adenine-specific DNA-methyltransferase PglX [Bacillus sp. TL12]MCI0766550.1 BREX-1 system adenine-specific DNA-methyltransferase PglX [Bacillus sp. TL12]
MNKSALKTFAPSARKELLKKVEAKAMKIGITEETIKKADIESSDAIFIDGKQLSKEEKIQRKKLIARINQIGFKQVLEEVAYTWFNRFTALRFMEVNEYLPTGVRVLSSLNPNSADPDMLNEALELDLEIDKEYVYELKLNNKTEELFKYLIIKHCNHLNKYLPFMFKTIDDYTEILFPEGLLAKESFVRRMTDKDFIPEDNWQNVEIVGWLYQYYIAEEKDRVIKAKKKYKTQEIPFATQLFTPDWIVRYMVQNSLGRYWVESHPEHRDLLVNWEFYLENPNPEPDFEGKLATYINKGLNIEDIKCFDPAMGSGHILVYMFDVLYEIYSKCGYMEREIPRLILENNLYGLDIDDRAYQLACFSVVMKALEYNSRFFRSIEREGLELHLASIQETNVFNTEEISYIAGEGSGEGYEKTKNFINQFENAKIIGSLIKTKEFDIDYFKERLKQIEENPAQDLFQEEVRKKACELLPKLIIQAEIMNERFDILVSNPPYIGNRYMNKELINYAELEYKDSKADLFSMFIEYSFSMTKKYGQIGFMTPFVWMFISSYEKLRSKLISNKNISSLIQLEYSGFEEATVPICAFTLRNYNISITGEFVKLSDFPGAINQPKKVKEAVMDPRVPYRYSTLTSAFNDISGYPISYWATKRIRDIFDQEVKLSEIAEPKTGIQTGNNTAFLRYWFEVPLNKIGFNMTEFADINKYGYKWFPYNKGGEFRKWYGNNDYVVNMENNGESIKNFGGKNNYRLREPRLYFKESITWSFISSSKFGVRYSPRGFLFDVAGSSVFPKKEDKYYLIALLCSKLTFEFLKLQNPTLNFQVENISKLPVILNVNEDIRKQIDELSKECITLSKSDWDSYETSWEFKIHPLISDRNLSIEENYEKWRKLKEEQFDQLKSNEEKLNKSFIDIYNLNEEMSPQVEGKDITVRIADKEKEIVSFISYAVGCILGRYSLDEEGLVYAGGKFNPEKYSSFKVDKDNIIPILSGAYFEDDIVSKFIEFVQITFGKATSVENLEFIAETLGKKKGETAKETIRRYFLNDFFKDHVQMYKKRPIYWQFTSGKQKAFNCLIYMHRYDETTLSRIRTDYLHEYQIRLDAEKKDLLNIIEGDYTTKEISNAKKELKTLDKKIDELKEYDELLHHMADMQIEIDLDDGIKVNYEKFKGLVAKI